MPIDDLKKEPLYPLRLAVRFAPKSSRTGRSLHVSALYRWAKGVRSPSGRCVRLAVVRCPSGLATSREAMRRFLAELSEAEDVVQPPTSSAQASRSSNRRKSQDDAKRELDAAGL